MKKTYVLTVDYDKSAKSICESFGISTSELVEFQMKIVASGKNTFTESLIEELDSNEVEGGIILALAVMYISTLHKTITMKEFMKQILDDMEEKA